MLAAFKFTPFPLSRRTPYRPSAFNSAITTPEHPFKSVAALNPVRSTLVPIVMTTVVAAVLSTALTE
jgi:hypothetical protein